MQLMMSQSRKYILTVSVNFHSYEQKVTILLNNSDIFLSRLLHSLCRRDYVLCLKPPTMHIFALLSLAANTTGTDVQSSDVRKRIGVKLLIVYYM